MIQNPFSPGVARPVQYVVGRADQWALVERTVGQVEVGGYHVPICFLAAGGLGKTTLLKQISSELQRRQWLCGYSEASSDTATAVLDLLVDAHQALRPEGIGARFLRRLTELNITAGPVGFGFKLGELKEGTAYAQLAELLTSLGEAARSEGVGVALLIDEAQVLDSVNLEILFRVIGRLHELPIIMVLGGLPSIAEILIMASRSPPLAQFSYLRPLKSAEARDVLAVPVADAGAAYEPEALASLVKFAEGHPLVLQMLGSSAWHHAEQTSPADEALLIKSGHAEAAISATKSQLTISVYQPVWTQCKKSEKKLLRALAASGNEWQSENDILASLKALRREPEEVLYRLSGRGVVYWESEKVRVVVPGFDEFIRRRSNA